MRFVCTSDTHGYHRDPDLMPDGDVLLHTGDFCPTSKLPDVDKFGAWIAEVIQTKKYRHAIVIAGNHDIPFEHEPKVAQKMLLGHDPRIVYLQDQRFDLDGIKIWGSPWQPVFHDWAFNLPRGASLAQKWALIPEDTEVLLTHGPPYGTLDQCPHFRWRHVMERVGCEALRERLDVLRPAFHQFGHVHESAGVHEDDHTLYLNAAFLDGKYLPRHDPHVVDMVDGKAEYIVGS